MKKYIYIGVGGMLGAMSRFGINHIHLWNPQGGMPFPTLMINLSGSFLLLLFLTIAFDILRVGVAGRLAIATGFLGAYTTFSTLCKETVQLLFSGEYITAVIYILASAVLGLLAAYLGMLTGRKIINEIMGAEIESEEVK